MNEILLRTPLFDELKKIGGKMVPFAGWEMPIQFAGIKAEHFAVRNEAGLFDVSHMCEFWLEGPDALREADRLVTNNVLNAADGQIVYSPMCNSNGGIVDDLLVYKYHGEKILLVVNAACRHKDLAHIEDHLKGDVTLTDKTDQTGQLALQGPASEDILAEITQNAFRGMKYFHFAEGLVANVPCIISRTGYTAEDGYELYCEKDKLVPLFRAVMEAGKDNGLKPIGLGARDTLRLEGRLSLYGNDIDLNTSPLEGGLGWTVDLKKDDFIGKEALLNQKAAGLTRRLVGFEMIDRAIARHGYPVVPADASPETDPIGEVTSGSVAPTLGKNIGLAYLPVSGYKTGVEFGVVIRGKVKRAVIVKTPFYKRPQ